jgi:hypothetical protein
VGATPSGLERRGWLIVAAGLALILVGGFMPWLRSGRAWRNSYEVVRTADRLGLVANGYESVLAVFWYLVPLLCGLTLMAIVFERPWLAHLGSVVVAGLTALMTAVALRARFTSGRGPEVAALGALLVVAGSLLAAMDRRSLRARTMT